MTTNDAPTLKPGDHVLIEATAVERVDGNIQLEFAPTAFQVDPDLVNWRPMPDPFDDAAQHAAHAHRRELDHLEAGLTKLGIGFCTPFDADQPTPVEAALAEIDLLRHAQRDPGDHPVASGRPAGASEPNLTLADVLARVDVTAAETMRAVDTIASAILRRDDASVRAGQLAAENARLRQQLAALRVHTAAAAKVASEQR